MVLGRVPGDGAADSGGLVAKLCPTLVAPWTVAHQAPLSMGFSRQEYWSGLPFPSPGNTIIFHLFKNTFLFFCLSENEQSYTQYLAFAICLQ